MYACTCTYMCVGVNQNSQIDFPGTILTRLVYLMCVSIVREKCMNNKFLFIEFLHKLLTCVA